MENALKLVNEQIVETHREIRAQKAKLVILEAEREKVRQECKHTFIRDYDQPFDSICKNLCILCGYSC